MLFSFSCHPPPTHPPTPNKTNKIFPIPCHNRNRVLLRSSQQKVKAKGSISASPIEEFPMTPAADAKHDGKHDGMNRKPGSGSNSGSGRSKSGSGKRFKKAKHAGGPSPPPSASSSTSTPLSTLSFNSSSSSSSGGSTSTPQSAGGLSNTSPASIASMTLDPFLWKLVERGETCPFPDCAFTVAFLEEKELAKAKNRAKANAASAGAAAAGDPQGTEEAALIEIGGVGNSNMNSGGGRPYSASSMEGGPGGERSTAGGIGFSKVPDENGNVEGMLVKVGRGCSVSVDADADVDGDGGAGDAVRCGGMGVRSEVVPCVSVVCLTRAYVESCHVMSCFFMKRIESRAGMKCDVSNSRRVSAARF